MQTRNTVSIALASYNGEKYISEQLESIINQSLAPNEIIICDDNSQDKTVALIEHYQKTSIIPIKIFANKKRLGVVKNFEKAIKQCNGDIIFLSDQDDFWLPDKIKKYIEYFSKKPSINAICSDVEIVNNNLKPAGYSLWQLIKFNHTNHPQKPDKDLFVLLLNKNIVCGATLAFRKKILKITLPIDTLWAHDAWIGARSIICAPRKNYII